MRSLHEANVGLVGEIALVGLVGPAVAVEKLGEIGLGGLLRPAQLENEFLLDEDGLGVYLCIFGGGGRGGAGGGGGGAGEGERLLWEGGLGFVYE